MQIRLFEDSGLQIRDRKTTLRAEQTEGGDLVATGRAVPYGVETVLWEDGYYEERETIQKGAFGESIRDKDQRALWNHHREIVLGRTSNDTLKLTELDAGVDFEIIFPPSPEGQSKFTSVERGDVDAMSFGWLDLEVKEEFFKLENKRIYKRTVIKGDLREVSPVSFAAYDGATSIHVRSTDQITHTKELIDSRLTEASVEPGTAAVVARDQTLRDMQIQSMGGTHGTN